MTGTHFSFSFDFSFSAQALTVCKGYSKIVPAMPGSWLREGAAVCFSDNQARLSLCFFSYILSYVEIKTSLFFDKLRSLG